MVNKRAEARRASRLKENKLPVADSTEKDLSAQKRQLELLIRDVQQLKKNGKRYDYDIRVMQSKVGIIESAVHAIQRIVDRVSRIIR